ncbi:lysophospholipid acyltransferase family protein [Thauera linaloolentis]|uniref:1-acyl-sn-glycerol-3-phosphate acyltransferase n=1 Tax=Thauera linaloolentis (strain DSM 12138 / JCM 21573 / CCUG 41526 / CIP 105981 / IAM 15112 / NBRC 102519 / 47Lol) TaxID=1123367 RepID=N6Z2P2_THAL4|nr:lysophospholipid acyltransferase family protein [Thauera linaloolentis]ENO86389.1 1-acyl-sn-glycerol-3-phosphate acyltransferase [Thauera linaloolentis 47Lol = DSM 12138]MCM8564201.1 1-acyl-sn-glycerol-3-phosphate acyltransferase [Thauera linaloolentis]
MLRAWRYLRLALHLLEGALTLLLCVPFCARPTHLRLRQRWSLRMLGILGLRLQFQGAPIAPGTMLVANHVSWLDIFVINAMTPAAFVSKAEVRNWPVIGWLAAKSDTIFLHRGSRGHARIINAEIATLLDAGDNVAIFPEGTTTDGSRVLHFHAALLQPAIACGHAVQPLALAYRKPDGSYSRAPAYDGELTLGQCLANIIAERRLIACVSAAAPIETRDGTDRRSLAQKARATIMQDIGCADGDGQP